MTTVTVIESSTNDLGIEVKYERSERFRFLRVYLNGNRVAQQQVKHPLSSRRFVGEVEHLAALDVETCVEIRKALDEGLRLLRDGRSMAAST